MTKLAVERFHQIRRIRDAYRLKHEDDSTEAVSQHLQSQNVSADEIDAFYDQLVQYYDRLLQFRAEH